MHVLCGSVFLLLIQDGLGMGWGTSEHNCLVSYFIMLTTSHLKILFKIF